MWPIHSGMRITALETQTPISCNQHTPLSLMVSLGFPTSRGAHTVDGRNAVTPLGGSNHSVGFLSGASGFRSHPQVPSSDPPNAAPHGHRGKPLLVGICRGVILVASGFRSCRFQTTEPLVRKKQLQGSMYQQHAPRGAR